MCEVLQPWCLYISVSCISEKPRQIIAKLLCMLRIAMAQSFSDNNAICLATSSFVDDVMFAYYRQA